MPPKKAKTKNVEKKKAKLVEDKTFGMKNKNKSSKVQKYVQSVQKQVDYQMSGNPKKVKGKEKAEIEEFIAYKPAVAQKKVEKGMISLAPPFVSGDSTARGSLEGTLDIHRSGSQIDSL